ncbi:hypothetical protein Tco_0672724 [Tanacetum coccineum]
MSPPSFRKKPQCESRRLGLNTSGSSKGTGVSLRVPDESTIILKASSEGTGTKPGVPDEEKETFAAKVDVILDWGSEQESEYFEEEKDDEEVDWIYYDEDEENKDDADYDKSIDLEKTDDEFVHLEEQVNGDEDEEIIDAEVAESEKGDEEITDTAKADAKKTEEVKDDIKKAEFPLSSSSLLVSSGFGNQFLNLSSDKSTSTVKNALEKTPLLVAQSSSQAQSSLQAAESLSEYELKMILFEKMDKSHSYLNHGKLQALFDALLNSISLDDVIARCQADPEKVLRKRNRDDKNPSVRPNQGQKTKRSKTKESEPSKKSSTSKESFKGKSHAKTSKSGKSVTAEELVFEMACDDIEQNVDDVNHQMTQLKLRIKLQRKIGSNILQGLLLLIQNRTSVKL